MKEEKGQREEKEEKEEIGKKEERERGGGSTAERYAGFVQKRFCL